MEYQQIAARGCCPCSVRLFSFVEGVLERRGKWFAGLVFGTLLGPEATGPGGVSFPGLFVSGFLAASIMRVEPFCGVVCGVCGLGLLFENYIVDASIFYKKQFPRI